MALMIKGLHIEELIIGTEYEEEQTVQPQDEPKKDEPKKAEPKEKPKATKKAKPIDKGKIGALRKAGCSHVEKSFIVFAQFYDFVGKNIKYF